MLSHLTISNFAIIDRLELDLAPGFNVFTGETGAGKSIIIDAVSLLLGGKADTDLIRSGAEKATVEGLFAIKPEALPEALREEVGGDEGLILSREISRSGRALARLNGRIIPLSMLKEVGQRLVDIHNQGEHLSLLRVKEHLDFLDRYAALYPQRERLAEEVGKLHGLRRELEKLLVDERELARQVDRLTQQIKEIQASKLRPGEDEELKKEHTIQANAQRLIAEANAAYEALYGNSEGEKGSLDLLADVKRILAGLEKIDTQLGKEREAAEEIQARLTDLARAIREYRDRIDYRPGRLAEIEERMDLIYNLKRKYGESIEQILAFAENAERELQGISHRTERIAQLQAEEKELLSRIGEMARQLSRARKEAVARLSSAIEEELKGLQMEKARFSAEIKHQPAEDGIEIDDQRLAFDATGIDLVEFMVSPNPGEPTKPLAKIASGGETSRLMLALKTVLVSADRTPSLIFDEIDAGLGARAGEIVGHKLWSLTSSHQVLC
ncbi:MAG: DNA repair protein RecN, partial [Chloroflexi bacterium]|nr:DNA repair protein RecN [Chloroflexota bacterium]